MLLATLCLIFCLFVELVLNFKKHLTYAFTLYFTGIALIFLGTVLYIVKISYIHLYTNMDSYIYQLVVGLRIGVSGISRIITFGTALFMFGSVYLFNIIGRKQTLGVNIMLIAPIIFILVWYDPAVSYRLFITLSSGTSRIINHSSINFANKLLSFVFAAYMIFPLVRLYRKYHRSQIHSVLVNAIVLGICIVTMDIYVLWCFNFGFLSVFMPWNVDLNKFITVAYTEGYTSVFIPLTILFLISVLYITVWYKPLGSIKFMQAITRKHIFKEFDQNLSIVFHSNKNLFLAINRLSQQFNEYADTDPETAASIVKDIEELSAKGLDTLTSSLNMMSDINRKNHTTDLCVCVRDAIEKASVPASIRIIESYTGEPETAVINASPAHITECLVNVINNAADAINEAERKNGVIKIRIIQEDDYACVEITDNGCGLSKRSSKNMFSMLYSTKKSSTNWGIGLAYTRKVILAYDGSIYVKSRLGEYTMFQITLPLANKR